jgi:hypothetical protein
VIFQLDDENKEPSSSAILKPRSFKERYRWLGILLVAAFAGIGPAPSPPKPPREIADYSQIAEDPDGLKLDPEMHFMQKEFNKDDSSMDA